MLRRSTLPALLVLMLAPAPTIAHAENATGKVYVPAIPSIENEPPPTKGNPHKPAASHPGKPGTHTPASGPSATNEQTAETRTGPQSRQHPHRDTTPPGKGGKHPPRDGTHRGSRDEVTGKNIASDETRSPSETSAPKKSSGGSSPVVALLIAVAVLAAISIGIARHRLRG